MAADGVWHAGHGMARLGAALEALRSGLHDPGRPGHAAGALGAHGGELRLCDLHHSRLAHDYFPALLCGGRDLFRLCPGGDPGHSGACTLPTKRSDRQVASWTIFIGTLGMFSFFFLLFLRFLPAISIAEMKALLPESKVQEAEVHV